MLTAKEIDEWQTPAEKRAMMREAAEAPAVTIMTRNGMPAWAQQIVLKVCAQHDVPPTELLTTNRSGPVVRARWEAYYLIRAHCPTPAWTRMGRWFDRDHSGILVGIAKHAAETGVPTLVGTASSVS